MDNHIQIEEILKYREHISKILGRPLDNNIAAQIWVRKYAEIWRLKHPRYSPQISVCFQKAQMQ